MTPPQTRVLHLIDDTTAGGVTRVIDHLMSSEILNRHSRHEVHAVKRGHFGKLPADIDVIVSHTVINWRTLPALIALRAARPNTPLIHVEHSYTECFVAHNVTRKRRFKSLLQIAFSLFDRIVAVSHAQAAWIEKHHLCASAQLKTIPSSVDLSPFQGIKAPTGAIKTLGVIGRLDRQKGFDTVIAAFKRLPDPNLRLKIIGKGLEEQTLKALASTDERIRFMGHIANPVDSYSGVDAVIMPSRWEAFGLVAIEALAAGRPLLCAPTDGLRDHAGLGAEYVSSLAPDDFAKSIQQFINRQAAQKNRQSQCRHPLAGTASMTLWANLITDFTRRDEHTIRTETNVGTGATI